MICVLQHDVGQGLVITSEISKSYYNLSTMKMKYLLEKNNSWFCYFTLLTQQTLRREGSLWKPLERTMYEDSKNVFGISVAIIQTWHGPHKATASRL